MFAIRKTNAGLVVEFVQPTGKFRPALDIGQHEFRTASLRWRSNTSMIDANDIFHDWETANEVMRQRMHITKR